MFAEQAIICSEADFETLFPTSFAAAPLTRCKLQMLRTVDQPAGWSLGPALCAGLTLTHYESFRHCTALAALKTRMQSEFPFHVAPGVHVKKCGANLDGSPKTTNNCKNTRTKTT